MKEKSIKPIKNSVKNSLVSQRKQVVKTGNPVATSPVEVLSGKEKRLANLTPWKPGQSGNPNGRPKKITDALNHVVTKKRARNMANAIVAQAEEGNVMAFQEVANRIEGKIPQSISGEDGGPLEIAIITHNIGSPKP